ncbi:RNA 2',3'-cyclic phosphodiesterase [compost metagenome]
MSTPPLRLFFALPCPSPLAQDIASWRDSLELRGRPIAADNLHITLAFLGNQPRGRVAELQMLAGGLTASRFELVLDRLDLWRNGLLHLSPSRVPADLLQLTHDLREALQAGGFELEKRAFHPHLTLVRHSQQPSGTAVPPFAWQAREFALFVSEAKAQGSHYRAIGRWPLQDTGPTVSSAGKPPPSGS